MNTIDINAFNTQFNNLMRLPAGENQNTVQRDIARETITQVQNKYGLNESESKGLVAYATQGYLENKGIKGDELDIALAKQLDILKAGQADQDSFRFWMAKNVPTIAPITGIAGAGVFAYQSLGFASAIMAGGGLAAGYAALGPIGIIAGAVAALSYVLPSALNTSNDYTAMQPTMMGQLLMNIKKEQETVEGLGIMDYGALKESDVEGLYQAFLKAGIQGYGDPLAMQSRMLTKANLLDTIKRIVGQLNTQGISPTKKDVVAVLSSWMLNEVSALPNREIKVPEQKQTTTSYSQTPKTRVSQYKTAKPKLFKGVLFNGQVGEYEQFVREVDDQITDDEDLRNDIEINLTKYIATIPNNLSYSVQIKNSPNDELGIPRTGTWCTLSIYLTNQFHKRVFIDEILLGPVDPYQYYPESQVVEQLQFEIPGLVKFDTTHPIDRYTGQERIVDTLGTTITDVLRDGTRTIASERIIAPRAESLANIAAGTEKAIPNSISTDGVSQHNQPPLFGTLYRVKGSEGLVFNPWPELYTPEEIERLNQDPGKFAQNEQKLKDRGVNTSQVRQFQYHDLEPWFKLPQRTVGFAEFFGSSTPATGFPKQVHVLAAKLNVRSQPTSQSATAGSIQLTKGDVFTAVALVEGETVNGNNKWWKSSLGNFVWSGGTD